MTACQLILFLTRVKTATNALEIDGSNVFVIDLQVAKLNPKDHSFTLKDEFYSHVQKDWPGYLEEEKQLIHRLLARWVWLVLLLTCLLYHHTLLHIFTTEYLNMYLYQHVGVMAESPRVCSLS